MTTAREQARAAADSVYVWGRQGEDAADAAQHAADAASDVWEPLLREVLELADGMYDQNNGVRNRIRDKLGEALDERT